MRECRAAWNERLKVEEGWGIGGRGAVHSLKNPGSSSALEWLVITKHVIMRRDKDNMEIKRGDA